MIMQDEDVESTVRKNVNRGVPPLEKVPIIGNLIHRANNAITGGPYEGLNEMMNYEVRHRVNAARILQEHESGGFSEDMTKSALLGEYAKTGNMLYANLAKQFKGESSPLRGDIKRLNDYVKSKYGTDPSMYDESTKKAVQADKIVQFLKQQINEKMYGKAIAAMNFAGMAEGADSEESFLLKDEDELSGKTGSMTDDFADARDKGSSLTELGMSQFQKPGAQDLAMAGPMGIPKISKQGAAESLVKSGGYDPEIETKITGIMKRFKVPRSKVVSFMKKKGMVD